MAQLQIRFDLSGVVNEAKAAVHASAMGRLHGAVQHVSQMLVSSWQEGVLRAKLWSGERDAYSNSIRWRMTGDLSAEVWTDYQQAEPIENGRPAYDLKRMLDTSLKTRVSKTGRRYLIIPFRHNTPGYTAHSSDMPAHVHEMAKKLTFSSVKGMGQRVSGTGAWDVNTKKPLTVPQAKYLWGTRLAPGAMGPNAKGKTDRFAGMVRFADTATAGKKKSIYMTFRVMAEGSKGWVIGARPGQHLARTATEAMQQTAIQEFTSAVRGEL